MGVEAGVVGWVATFFLESGVTKEDYAQLLTSILWAAFLAGRLGYVVLSKYFTSRKIVFFLSITTLIFMVVLLSSGNLAVMLIGTIGTGLGMSGIYASALAGISDVLEKYTFAMSVNMLITSVGAIIVPYLIGELAERQSVSLAMWVLAGIALIQVILSVVNMRLKKQKSYRKLIG